MHLCKYTLYMRCHILSPCIYGKCFTVPSQSNYINVSFQHTITIPNAQKTNTTQSHSTYFFKPNKLYLPYVISYVTKSY